MAQFITTIRLQAATEIDYEKLSLEMSKIKFQAIRPLSAVNSMVTKSSLVFKTDEKKSLFDCTESVSHAAAATGKKYSFFVIKDKDLR